MYLCSGSEFRPATRTEQLCQCMQTCKHYNQVNQKYIASLHSYVVGQSLDPPLELNSCASVCKHASTTTKLTRST